MMETISTHGRLRKVCPQCSGNVHIRRAVCGCGFAFPSKRKARPDNVLQAKKQLKVNARATETAEETVARKTRDRVCGARHRTERTWQAQEPLKQLRKLLSGRHKTEHARQARKPQKQLRKLLPGKYRMCKSRKRVLESPEQVLLRKQTNKEHMSCMLQIKLHSSSRKSYNLVLPAPHLPMRGKCGGGPKTSLSKLHYAFSITNLRWGSAGNRKPWTKLRVPGTAGRTNRFRDNPGNSGMVGNYVNVMTLTI